MGPAAGGGGTYDVVSHAAGLPLLRDAVLRLQEREVRVWIGGSPGYPQHLYRLWERRGAVHGEVIAYWPLDRNQHQPRELRYEQVIRYYQRGTCGKVRRLGRMETCRVRLTRQPDWAAVLRQAEGAGLWTLEDEVALHGPRIVIDGTRMTVETQDGTSYREYTYGKPGRHDSPESRAAGAIKDAVVSVLALARPPVVERAYRGLYASGPSLREFRTCGSGMLWHLEGSLDGPAGWVDAPRSDTIAHPIVREYVEMIAAAEPEALARVPGAAEHRTLYVRRMTTRHPWEPAWCRRGGRGPLDAAQRPSGPRSQ
jgi:hypothetical protein